MLKSRTSLRMYEWGEMVIIVDDEERENEGDLMMAAEKIQPEDINFMLQYARGLMCLTLTQNRCKLLGHTSHGQQDRW